MRFLERWRAIFPLALLSSTEEIGSRGMTLGRLVCRYLIRSFCDDSLIMDVETGWVHCTDSGEFRSDHFARQEFDFLFLCAEHAGQLVTHAQLDRYVFGRDMRADRGKRTTMKKKVDRKVRRISVLRNVRSVRSEGYMLWYGDVAKRDDASSRADAWMM